MCFIVDKYMWTTHCGAGIFCCVCSHGNMLLYSVAILGPCLILDIQWYDVVSCLFVCFLWKHVSLLDSCLDLSLIQRILGSQMQVYIWHVLSTPDKFLLPHCKEAWDDVSWKIPYLCLVAQTSYQNYEAK